MERFRNGVRRDQIYSIYEAARLDATRKKEWIDTARSWSEIRIKIERIQRLRRIPRNIMAQHRRRVDPHR